MARAGIGVDMLEIARMRRAMERHPSILRRTFTEEECAYCETTARPAEHYAARFAAREAVLKALGTGFSDGIGMKDVSVGRGDDGRPRVVLMRRAAELAQAQGVQEVVLSLSHTREVAVANAVAVTQDVRPQVDDVPDPVREMQASFREARSVIDELERLQDGIMDILDSDTPSQEQTASAPASGDAMGE